MKTIKEILQSADPLEHESEWAARERTTTRNRIVLSASEGPAKPAGWSRRSILTASAVVVVATLAVFFGVPGIGPHGVTNVQAAVHFEMRLAEDMPGDGLQAAVVTGSGRTIYLHEEILITNSDISRAAVAPGRTPGTFNVEVLFTKEGAEKINRTTAEHIGRPIALVVDGTVVNAPTVRSAIGDSAIINGDFTEAEAEIMAAGIDKR